MEEGDLRLNGVRYRQIDQEARTKIYEKINRHFWYEFVWLMCVILLYIGIIL